ncbi:nitroreductase family protein [Infirmifilum lucidum]|uniref:nitroreductase family protein n=1 Tax=Infirmifilum lucidum TaxID=2776706 RepID=UPI001CEC9E4F|nr:nitroreductase family protein [Infirmifilum lucidum]
MCVDLLLTRRSIRAFQDREVPDELVVKAVDIARHAPSARNRQPWRVIAVRNRATLRELSQVAPGAKPLESAPLALAVVVKPELSPVSFMLDGAIFTTYLWLALHSLGLGAVWIQTLRQPRYAEILGIPPGEVLIAILAAGYPAESPPPRPRKSVEELLTWM